MQTSLNKHDEPVFMSYDDALELVDRIARRCLNFRYTMHENEKDAMAQLLSDCGVMVKDIINVDNLADNYAINAEIVCPQTDKYFQGEIEDYLFTWDDGDRTYYCVQW